MPISFAQATRLALVDALQSDSKVVLMGLGVADPKGIFGTTTGLQAQFGRERVFDIPLSENALTGVALGMAMMGLRPIFTHQRADFSFTSAEQLINQVAKTIFTTCGKYEVPLVVRIIVGRGWGQGPTHAQAPHGLYAGIPGLRVVAPSTPRDAYTMMRLAIDDPNPVIVLEHRWLHDVATEQIPGLSAGDKLYEAEIVVSGDALTLVGVSYGLVDAARVVKVFLEFGIQIELINLRSISPLDTTTLLDSVVRTKNMAMIDIAAPNYSLGAEISRVISEVGWDHLEKPPLMIGPRFGAVPSSPQLAKLHYPSLEEMTIRINERFDFGLPKDALKACCRDMFPQRTKFGDLPEAGLIGPF